VSEESEQTRPIIICPLRRELRLLQRSAPRGADVEWLCCGPGPRGVEVAAKTIGASKRTVILAGLAGGLTHRASAGTALVAAEVVEPTSFERWRSTWQSFQSDAPLPLCIVTSTDECVTTPAAKAALAARTGADMVDLESVAFAKAATALGWQWAVVRGISDGPDQALPPGIDGWVDSTGRTRFGSVLMALARRPALIPALFNMASTSKAALRRTGMLIARVEC
jgi:hypothetical protein